MPSKLLNIFALSALAILFCSFAPSQTLAVSVQRNHNLARQLPNHHGIAKKKKKRDNCKPRSSSSSPPAGTPASQPTNPPAQGNSDTPSQSYPPSSTTSSSSSPSTSPTNTPSITPTGSGKLAIAWALEDDPRIQILLKAPRVKMFHLWTADIPSILQQSGFPTSIMLWDNSQDRINDFTQKAVRGYATHANGFNEVNQVGQANMAVSDAVSAWQQYIQPLTNQGYTLGSPCTTSAPDGMVWMTQFFSDCSGCTIDEVLIHWYDVHFTDFQTYVQNWFNAFKKPIRITEFACQNFNGGDQPSADDIWSFTTQAIEWLESYDPCLTYAPFGFMDDLYNVNPADGLFIPGDQTTLSSLGWLYVNGP